MAVRASECCRKLAGWIMENADQFPEGQWFLLAVGFTRELRLEGRAICSRMGPVEKFREIAAVTLPMNFLRDWGRRCMGALRTRWCREERG